MLSQKKMSFEEQDKEQGEEILAEREASLRPPCLFQRACFTLITT